MMYNQYNAKAFLRKIGKKTIFSALLVLLTASSLFAKPEYVLKVTLNDGSVKEYAVRYITKISFKADPNDEMDDVQDEYKIDDENLEDFPSFKRIFKKVTSGEEIAIEDATPNTLKIIPTKGSVLVSSTKETPAKVFIFNMQGMCLKKFGTNLHSGLNQFELDKATFKNNQYILRVKTPTNESSSHFSIID